MRNDEKSVGVPATDIFAPAPFATVAVGRYGTVSVDTAGGSSSGDISKKALHEWIMLGLRGAFGIDLVERRGDAAGRLGALRRRLEPAGGGLAVDEQPLALQHILLLVHEHITDEQRGVGLGIELDLVAGYAPVHADGDDDAVLGHETRQA